MKFEHLSLILGLTPKELKRRLELGLIDQELLNRQISDCATDTKLDALCDSWYASHQVDQQLNKFEIIDDEPDNDPARKPASEPINESV